MATHDHVLAGACAGLGLAILPCYVARESLAAGVVRPVLTDHALPSQEMHAVFPSPKLVPQKVIHFIDHLQQAPRRRLVVARRVNASLAGAARRYVAAED